MCIHCSVGQDEGECQCAEIAKLCAKIYDLRERNHRLAKKIKKATAERERLRVEVERHRMTREEREALLSTFGALMDMRWQDFVEMMRGYLERTKEGE